MGSRPPSLSRPMRNLLAGFYTSLIGSQMAPIALAFAVLGSGHGVAGIGLVLGASRLPTVGFILVGGVLADRVPRRTLMLITDLVRAVSQGLLAVWMFTGHVPLAALMLFAAVDGLGSAFFRPALSGLVPSLAGAASLQRANALLGFGRSVSSLAGPALGGVLVAAFDPGIVFAVDAGSYLVSALFLMAIPRDAVAPRPAASSLFADLRDGWAEFRSRRWLWSIVAQFSLIHLTAMPAYLVLGPQIAADGLGGARGWGFILGGFGAGAVAGGLLMVRFTARRPLLTAMAGLMAFVPALLTLALSAPLPVVVAAGFVAGTGMGVFGALWDTTLQANVPRQVLSRVSAYDWFGSLVTLPLGYVLVGFLAHVVGPGILLVTGAAVIVATCLAVVTVPDVRHLTSAADATAPSAKKTVP
ncbi:MFS transporter [Actinoplanes sp. NEAU-A12]|uniref:MFS transporter n=1 Tax=Actinoplanes sandaracinus TaxID=3045177 RepID=A0ABT6WM70_9ACTN|nr:MFS transporter [Actinoplanes sandaracinus]MDI6100830.1 MFS transporter [Actinoplanes sandaracinus]